MYSEHLDKFFAISVLHMISNIALKIHISIIIVPWSIAIIVVLTSDITCWSIITVLYSVLRVVNINLHLSRVFPLCAAGSNLSNIEVFLF